MTEEELIFIQGEPIQDYIFPLVRHSLNDVDTYDTDFIGTSFFIGSRGFAITAGHVIDQLLDKYDPEKESVTAVFQQNGQWFFPNITNYEKHPSEDVGIIKIEGDSWKSILDIISIPQNSTAQYHCWGYPREAAEELIHIVEGAGKRPELIFTEGYVRRRISRPLRSIQFKGEQFYELSEIVGGGASGAPIILRSSVGTTKWKVFGVYIGELNQVSYAVRAEAFYQWAPEILGRSIMEES